MRLLLEFDISADIIDVPQNVIDNREYYQKKFFNWLYNPLVKHRFREKAYDADGHRFIAMHYRGDAFVEYLNLKVLKKEPYQASIVEEYVHNFEKLKKEGMPYLFF